MHSLLATSYTLRTRSQKAELYAGLLFSVRLPNRKGILAAQNVTEL